MTATCPVCGKIRFPTRKEARLAARRHKHRWGKLRAYKCGEFWHITSQSTARTTAFRAWDAEQREKEGKDEENGS